MEIEIIKYISQEKFSTYIKYNNNENIALNLYDWNVRLSEALYAPLNYFEIVFRNACYDSISKEKDKYWYLDNKLMSGGNPKKGDYAKQKIQKAFNGLVGYRKKYPFGTTIKEVNSCDIISNLELGFWINLFVQNYFNSFWDTCLKYLFKDYDRRELHHKLDEIRSLRNRIFHHENILKYNLQNKYNIILEIIETISPKVLEKLKNVSNFEKTYMEYNEFVLKNLGAPLNQS